MGKKSIIEDNILNTIRLDLYGVDKKTIAEHTKLSVPPITDLLINGLASEETVKRVQKYIKKVKLSKIKKSIAA